MHKFHLLTGLLSPVFFRTLFVSLAFAVAGQLPVQAQALLLPTTQLMVGSHAVSAEIAATENSRSFGLMQRQSLPPNHGMLFIFNRVGTPCFWMKDTPLPLSIAFINAKGVIVNITDMLPNSLDAHCPAGPVLYALEMQQGWFKEHQVQAGTQVTDLQAANP